MDAKETCETVLSVIKKSNLNWSIVESPFSVTVTLRKSFIKNKDGSLLKSGLDSSTLDYKLGGSPKPQPVHNFPQKSHTKIPMNKEHNTCLIPLEQKMPTTPMTKQLGNSPYNLKRTQNTIPTDLTTKKFLLPPP